MAMNDQPQTREEYVELLRSLVIEWSRLHFELGRWCIETMQRFGMSQRQLADDINVSKSALNAWVNVVTFWRADGLSSDLIARVSFLMEERHTGRLTYTHFLKAMYRVSVQADTHEARLVLACDYLEHILDDDIKHSQMDAENQGNGDKASIVFDSDERGELSATDIGREVANQVRAIRLDGGTARVVVYRGSANG